MKFNTRENKWFSIVLTIFGVFLIVSGFIMNGKTKPMIQTKFILGIEKRKVSETRAKSNEIKIKDIEIEINNPISMDIKNYLENSEDLDEETLKKLKLDTSLVNINEAGTYKYTITFKKKIYAGTIKVKEKELPNMTFTLKTIKLQTKEALSNNPRSFINETITDEVYNNLTLDISNVDTSNQGDYTYYIIYKGVTYQGKVEVRNPAPKIIPPKIGDKVTCPNDATEKDGTCICKDSSKTYNATVKKCQ